MFHVSFISYLASHVTDEQICIGLIYITDSKTRLLVSDKKLSIVEKMDNKAHKSIVLYIDAVASSVDMLDIDAIIYQHKHQNGVVKVSYPKIFNMEFDEDYINQFFEKEVENKFG